MLIEAREFQLRNTVFDSLSFENVPMKYSPKLFLDISYALALRSSAIVLKKTLILLLNPTTSKII